MNEEIDGGIKRANQVVFLTPIWAQLEARFSTSATFLDVWASATGRLWLS